MTELITRMNQAMPLGYQLAFLIRVLVATLCGGAIGLEQMCIRDRIRTVRPSPRRRPMPPVSGLTTAKAISGRVVSSPEALPERPRLSVISGRRGPTPVMMIRRCV